MFEEIENYRIKIYNKEKKTLNYVPNAITLGPLRKLLKATDWLFRETKRDRTNTYKKIAARRKIVGVSQKNIDEVNDLEIRIGSRTQGYVNQICLMEDIMTFEYNRMFELIKEATKNKFTKFCLKKTTLKEELAPIRTFRNKVVAHTAFTHPKIKELDKRVTEEDNPETMIRSLLGLFPSRGGLTLGNCSFGYPKHRPQFQPVSILSWENEIKPILKNWEKLFIQQLEQIHTQCPYKNDSYSIEIATPARLAKIKLELKKLNLPPLQKQK